MTTMYLTQQTIYSTRCMRTCRAHAAPTAHSNKSCAHAASKSCIYIRMDAHLELESSSEQVQMEMGAVLMGRSESYPANIVDSSILLTRQYCRLATTASLGALVAALAGCRFGARSAQLARRPHAARPASTPPMPATPTVSERPPPRESSDEGGGSPQSYAPVEPKRCDLLLPHQLRGGVSEGRVREGEIRARLLVGMVND